ncbi:hypothetical protein ING2D1G_1584 [Peptoniphilus sp. ING2-D1G]|nr:hypothetical protein ING2D1G_1584 [Peptoniphilus sp. ING2-D1G]
MLSGRNKIMQLELKNVSYIELIRFDVNYMRSINDSAKVRDILVALNSLKGEPAQFDSDESTGPDFINVYDKNFNKLEIAKFESFLKYDNKWYKLDSGSIDKFNKIFESNK